MPSSFQAPRWAARAMLLAASWRGAASPWSGAAPWRVTAWGCITPTNLTPYQIFTREESGVSGTCQSGFCLIWKHLIIIICTNTNDICLKSNSFQELISAAVYCQTQTPGCRDMTRVTITRRAVCCWPGGGRGPGSPCLGWWWTRGAACTTWAPSAGPPSGSRTVSGTQRRTSRSVASSGRESRGELSWLFLLCRWLIAPMEQRGVSRKCISSNR